MGFRELKKVFSEEYLSVIVRGVLIGFVIACFLSFVIMLFAPSVSDPMTPEDERVSNVVGVVVWVFSISCGLAISFDKWKRKRDKNEIR